MLILFIAFFFITHPLFTKIIYKYGDYIKYPYIKLDNLILFTIGAVGFIFLYLAGIIGIIKRNKTIKALKSESKNSTAEKNTENKPVENIEKS